MRIRNNGAASGAYRFFKGNNGALHKNLEKLSSGYQINRSADDAAGLAISEKMRAQITGLSGALQNASHGIGLIQTAEGALQESHDILNRMLELSTQSANGTYDDAVDRQQLQKEMTKLAQELDRIADTANFNGIYPLSGENAASSMAVLQGGLLTELEDWQEPQKFYKMGSVPVEGYTVAGTSGTPAKTSVNFSGQTGEDLIGSFMLVGHAGQYGKYQLVENAADVTSGYQAIVIESSDNASQLAQKIHNALGAISGFSASRNEEVITLKETQNQGAKSIPVTFCAKEPDEYDEVMQKLGLSASEISATLFWKVGSGNTSDNFSTDDLDLHCVTPDNNHIYWITRNTGGGILEVATGSDQSGGKDGKTQTDDGERWAVEHIYFPDATTLRDGEYRFFVHTWADVMPQGDSHPVLRIKIGDEITELRLDEEGGVNGEYPVDINANESYRLGYSKAFSFDYKKSDAWEGPKVTNTNGVAPTSGYTVPAKEGSLTETTIDFTGNTVGNLLGSKMTVLSQGGKREQYQFVGRASDAQEGYIPIVLGGEVSLLSSDSATRADAIADKVADSLNAISGFNFTSTNGKLSITEAHEEGKKPVIVYFYPREETDAPPDAELQADLSTGSSITLLVGETKADENLLTIPVFDMHADTIGLTGVDISTQQGAINALTNIRDAINNVSDVRGTYGAMQNRLEHTINNIGTMRENIQDAESTIRDTDMAAEMMKYTKNNILVQSAQSMLAQANMLPQGVLRLLQ